MLQRRVHPSGVVYYISPILERIGVKHGFSTRLGGVSTGAFASLNLGNPVGELRDDPHNIATNHRRLLAALQLDDRDRCAVHQVHGNVVAEVRCGQPFESGQRADAMISSDPTHALTIQTADCVPILISNEDGSIVAAIHAGWRGIVCGIVASAMKHFGDHRRFAAVGACMGVEAFEVGEEVVSAFTAALGSRAPVHREPHWPKPHVDLREAIRMQLIACGLSPADIDMTDRCTFTHADEFFSHRRDNGVTGRMAAVISPLRKPELG